MELLRRSIEGLATPICDVCNVQMAWSRSALIAEGKTILHVFTCGKCANIAETKTTVRPLE
jgi:hypothetical protein